VAFDSLLAPALPAAAGDARAVDLWSLLPGELATLFRPNMASLADEIHEEIRRTMPALSYRADSAFGRSISEGIHQALIQFVERLADPDAPREDRAQFFRELGLHEIQDGPILDVLQMAYRVGARCAWRRMSQVGEQAGVPIATLCLLAEALFAYIDELSTLSVEGHADAQLREAGALERRRRQLLDFLLSPGADTAPLTLVRLAEAARWPPPPRVTAVALDARPGAGGEVERLGSLALPDRVLVDLEGSVPCLLVGDADRSLLVDLPSVLPGWRAAVGPSMPLAEARRSLHWARRVAHLVQTGVLPDAPVTWFEQHMSALWLLNDTFLVREVSRRALAPMTALTGTQRDKLGDTLLTWLEGWRTDTEIAEILGVHPQTVRYRMRQLRKLFGGALDDSDARFDIEVALRAERALKAAGTS
jgi:DNA-binding CsgD family transcriptional regulator